MKAVILAAGVASRLRPLTDHTPKCLLKISSKNILELTIENILANKISEIIIVTGYLENKIRDFIDLRFPDLDITFIYNELYESTNNIYSLWLARDALKGHDMLLMDSDIVFDSQIIEKLCRSEKTNCLALKRHDLSDEEIKVKIDQKGRVIEISKEVKISEAAGESLGIELFGREAVQALLKIIERKVNIERNVNQFYEAAFQELIGSSHEIYVVDISEFFSMEIDTADDLNLAGELYNKK